VRGSTRYDWAEGDRSTSSSSDYHVTGSRQWVSTGGASIRRALSYVMALKQSPVAVPGLAFQQIPVKFIVPTPQYFDPDIFNLPGRQLARIICSKNQLRIRSIGTSSNLCTSTPPGYLASALCVQFLFTCLILHCPVRFFFLLKLQL
jgi:hypothetical protein